MASTCEAYCTDLVPQTHAPISVDIMNAKCREQATDHRYLSVIWDLGRRLEVAQWALELRLLTLVKYAGKIKGRHAKGDADA